MCEFPMEERVQIAAFSQWSDVHSVSFKTEMILLDFLEYGQIINSNWYMKALNKVKARTSRLSPEKKKNFVFQYNSQDW